MTALAVTLVVLFTAWMAWRGYRRGAAGTLLGWLPFVAAGAVLVLGLWLAWVAITYFVLLATVALLAAVATLILCFWAIRSARRRAAPRAGDSPPYGRFRSSLRALNRLLGAALGLLAASILSLSLALLGSTVSFAYSLASLRQSTPEAPAATPAWVGRLGRACAAAADVATFGVLDHVPRLGAYARELRALVTILNAPPDRLRRLAEKHGLTTLAGLPEVQAALNDQAYLDLVVRVAEGRLTAIKSLAAHPTTRALLASPHLRRLTATLTPSELARDLAPHPGA
ncbi:MAG: hypothetical protein FJ290_19690 [Planctomycetes bacterium]|nr:hypothetical protein [Planctomycetota bacterium]